MKVKEETTMTDLNDDRPFDEQPDDGMPPHLVNDTPRPEDIWKVEWTPEEEARYIEAQAEERRRNLDAVREERRRREQLDG
jgi:hypothetical protein